MAEDAGDKEKSESRFLDVSEESISVSFLVRVAKLHVLSQWLQLELRTPYHGIWLPLNHWLDQASGCISTLGIQRGRGVCLLNRVQFDAMQVTMHTIWLKHKTLSL
jgi:hypothetical protein